MKLHSWLRFWYRFLAQIVDPIRAGRGFRALGWDTRDLQTYRRATRQGSPRFADAIPAFHDRSARHEIDAHYFYLNA